MTLDKRIGVSMVGFTKQQMFDELRSILLYQAEALAIGAGRAIAAEFIGFEIAGQSSYASTPAPAVDLSNFDISYLFDRSFDFAFNPKGVDEISSGALERVESFMDLIPRSLTDDEMGLNCAFMQRTGFCQSVAIASRARWNLECECEGRVFTVQELALLANMSEGAVRNAIADKSEDGLKAVDRRKPVVVDHADASRWLSGRRGFVSALRPSFDRHVSVDRLVAARSVKDLIDFVRDRIALLEPDIRVQVNERSEHWLTEAFEYEKNLASWLCAKIDVDLPTFAGKSCEVIMRRDSVNPISRPASISPSV